VLLATIESGLNPGYSSLILGFLGSEALPW
jgi:hypothetical protein